MMRITAYADRLIDDLQLLDWSDSIKLMQRNWIGRSEGAEVRFATGADSEPIVVFTTRPDTLFGATYMVLATEHPLVDELGGVDWEDDVDPRWTGGAATPIDAVSPYREKIGRPSERARPAPHRAKTGAHTGYY